MVILELQTAEQRVRSSSIKAKLHGTGVYKQAHEQRPSIKKKIPLLVRRIPKAIPRKRYPIITGRVG